VALSALDWGLSSEIKPVMLEVVWLSVLLQEQRQAHL
jgi:hypothetical protein